MRVGEPQHRLYEIRSIGTVNPRSAKHERVRIPVHNRCFAFQLGPAIHPEWRGSVILAVGHRFAAIKYVIGRNVDKRNAKASRGCRELPSPVAIDCKCALRLGFRHVDCRVCGSIDNRLRQNGSHNAFDRARILQIKLRASGRENRYGSLCTDICKAPGELAILTGDKDRTHSAFRSACRSNEAEALAAIDPLSNWLPPSAVVKIPPNCGFETALEKLMWAPAKAALRF